MGIDLTIGLGTLVILVVVGALLLQARFGRRSERPKRADPAERWMHGQTESTPANRDKPAAEQNDDADRDGDADSGHP